MVQVVVKVKPEEVALIKDILLKEKDTLIISTTNQFEVFRIKYLDSLIVGYSSGKIVGSKEDVRILLSNILDKIHGNNNLNKPLIIGSDEAGKGEWLGPMVIAAVAVNSEREIELQTQGVMDSKELSLTKIHELSDYIRSKNFVYDYVIITPARFNDLYIQFKDENQTLNDLLAWGHSKVINEVYSKMSQKNKDIRIIIDEFDRFATEERLRRLFDLKTINLIQEPKAERNIAVAAASIIARDFREKYLDSLSSNFRKDIRQISIETALKDPYSFVYAKLAFLEKLASNKSST